MFGSKGTAREQRIAEIYRLLEAADRRAKEQGESVLYRETVESLAANLGRTPRTINDYLATLSTKGRIRIDTTENVILLRKPQEEPATEEEP